MRYAVFVLLSVMLIYMLSFARHNWRMKNKLAAVGAVILGVLAFGLMTYTIFSDKFEV